jgi:DNA mismatch endonuclease (patch repair protein)
MRSVAKSIRSRAPKASSSAVRAVMRANVGRATAPELRLRRLLFACGLRFRKSFRPDPKYRCTADVVFKRLKVCVFVDGCFWHGCPEHFSAPRTNGEWWEEKIADNRTRDLRQAEHLTAGGWLVIRVWEHEDPQEAAERILGSLSLRSSRYAKLSNTTSSHRYAKLSNTTSSHAQS